MSFVAYSIISKDMQPEQDSLRPSFAAALLYMHSAPALEGAACNLLQMLAGA